MKNMLGIVIGSTLDRRGGNSGVKGAVGGYIVESAVKFAVPMVLLIGAGLVFRHYASRGLGALAEELERQKAAAG